MRETTQQSIRVPAALMLLVCVLGGVAVASSKPYTISGAERDARKKWKATQVLEQSHAGVIFQIEYLDPAAARATVIKSLGRDMDLLPGRRGEAMPGYVVFLVQGANDSKEDALFNPNMARMVSDHGDVKIALDYTALYEIASHLGPDAPSSDELSAMIFDQELTLKPGGRARKLLVFAAPREDGFKSLEIRLAEVNIGAKAADFLFTFRKFFDDAHPGR